MRILTAITGALSLLSLAGCTGETITPSGLVLDTLHEVGGAPLRRDAEAIAAQFTTRDPFGPTKIPEALWTGAIRKFRPVYVYLRTDRLTIVTSSNGSYENGIDVCFPSQPDDRLASGEFAGGGSGRAEYKMEPGVYWFWAKIRSDVALRRKFQEPESQTKAIAVPRHAADGSQPSPSIPNSTQGAAGSRR